MYLSDKQAAARFSVSRITIWRWARETDFPSPIQLSPGCTRWKLAEIEGWESQRPKVAA
ncbi:AlpA family transcriptional regulator [Thioclava marina]|uniref:AlpA family transcriptional regulator n=1 Tax=Thioclava marina TaxID=1915077 RepID=A0ABX3MK94_9RHOB|nr:AlpA family phage regulatory protein [Thioclava marina]OOY11655.1 AlpA family transcriptional regulator [Thioclava marina]